MRTILVLLFASIAFAAPGLGQVVPREPFVYVKGEATISAKADIVIVEFRLMEQGDDLPAAMDRMKAHAEKCLSIVAEFHIPDRDIEAHKQTIQQLPEQDKAQRISNFRVTRSFKVRLREPATFSRFTDKIAREGAADIIPAKFEYSKIKELESECEALALDNAKAHAERIASKLARKIGKVHAVSAVEISTLDDVLLPKDDREGEFTSCVQRAQPAPIDSKHDFVIPDLSTSKVVHVIFTLE